MCKTYQPSLTGDENDYIINYKKRYPLFPHESTADQFFTEEQFEVYRALGFHAVSGLFDRHDCFGRLDPQQSPSTKGDLELLDRVFPVAPKLDPLWVRKADTFVELVDRCEQQPEDESPTAQLSFSGTSAQFLRNIYALPDPLSQVVAGHDAYVWSPDCGVRSQSAWISRRHMAEDIEEMQEHRAFGYRGGDIRRDIKAGGDIGSVRRIVRGDIALVKREYCFAPIDDPQQHAGG